MNNKIRKSTDHKMPCKAQSFPLGIYWWEWDMDNVFVIAWFPFFRCYCVVDNFHALSSIWISSILVCDAVPAQSTVALQCFVIHRLTIDVKIIRINYYTNSMELHENHELTSNYKYVSMVMPFAIFYIVIFVIFFAEKYARANGMHDYAFIFMIINK